MRFASFFGIGTVPLKEYAKNAAPAYLSANNPQCKKAGLGARPVCILLFGFSGFALGSYHKKELTLWVCAARLHTPKMLLI